jgi:hypothetical protein
MKNLTLLALILLLGFSCKTNSDSNSTSSTESQEQKSSGNAEYDKLISDYDLFGKWIISNSTVNESYTFEIYVKGEEYIGVIPQGEFKTEILEKRGEKYVVKDNQYGEYYIIDSDKNMKLFDKDGDLSSMGYKATKQ